MAEWFTALASQAIKLADDFTDSLVAQASDAQLQIQSEQQRLRDEEEQRRQQLDTSIQLPWETEDESRQILTDALMDSILKLSLNEKNFTNTPPNSEAVHFVFSDFIATAMRLLKLDINLGQVHSKISPKMNEEEFWRNYYCRVIFLRAISGIDGPAARDSANEKWEIAQVIFKQELVVRSSSRKTECVPASSPAERKPACAATKARVGEQLGSDDDEMLLGAEGMGGAEYEEEQGGEEEELDLGDLDDDLELLRELNISDDEGEEVAFSSNSKPTAPSASADGELGSYEEVGKSDCHSSTSNAELEAQIARELANMSDDDA